MRVRLRDAVDAVDAELIGRRLATLAGARLWVERAGHADDPLSVRRRESELARPVDAGDGVRAVLIQYAGGLADLVLVAHRATLGRSSLRALARAVLRADTPHAPPPPEHRPAGRSAESRSAGQPGDRSEGRSGERVDVPVEPEATVPWGLGDPRRGGDFAELRLALPDGVGRPGEWLAALAVVLSRYAPEEPVTVAVLDLDRHDRVTSIPVELTAATRLGELATRLAADLAAGTPAPFTAAQAPAAGLAFDAAFSHTASDDGAFENGAFENGAFDSGAFDSGAFDHAFDLGDDNGEGTEVEGVPIRRPSFPLTIVLHRDGEGRPELRCLHRLRSVGPEIAAQFARHLVHARRQVAASPARPARAAGLLDAAELTRVRALGLPPRELDSRPRRIEDVFAERAAACPDAVALSEDDVQVTYRELDERSDRMAHGLRALGVRDGDLVGMCLERSAELIAVMLGILKAGAVYVPMDPAYPADRLTYTVEDSGIRALVTTLAGFPAPDGLTALTPERLAELGDGRAGPPESQGRPGDPAYVIYTSGSTGRPKGVLVSHANVISLLDATREDFVLGPADVWTFFHSIAFDFSVWEVWGCLLTGGHLVVVPYWVSRSPEQFRALLSARGVTVLNQTPSAFIQLVAADLACADPLALRLVIFGGESLETPALLPWLDRYPESRCRLVNMYGITETTVHVTSETLDRGMALSASRSVGKPVPGWHAYVMDASGRPAPPGVAGEIYVGGAGVALGYLGRPALTAERFPADPFTGARLYRSGDRGRLRPDGKLEHLGRMDNQVKLRGFRIELDEIRLVLVESPGVAAAAVVLRQDDGDTATARLDAYVVMPDGTPDELRRHLARMLPEYMLPATVTVLPSMPLTANGKVDLAALPEPVLSPVRPSEEDDGDPAGGDEITGHLLDVWREIFGFPVRTSDDFFQLGGNSLFAIRMAAALRERGMAALHPRTLYLNPTVRQLADALRS
ncbi:amino acid adenylation domain-containing protein [Nonomuraea sp. NPDC002799]